jgi:uncharacterized YccA/Bax inhibitor family protein
MTSGNPAFATGVFDRYTWAGTGSRAMTITGTVAKTSLLLAILTATAGWTWTQVGNGTLNGGLLIGSLIGGAVLGLITAFKPTAAPITGPIYAACEGVLLGAISNLFNRAYPGIAMQAVSLTLATMLLMLGLYASRIIVVTQKLVMGIVVATGAVCIVYFVSWIFMMFHFDVPIFKSGLLGVGFSLVVVAIAAFNLLLDFDFIERGAQSGLPKAMEWYGAWALMVTLIWLYIEILRLLAKLQSRD